MHVTITDIDLTQKKLAYNDNTYIKIQISRKQSSFPAVT